MTSGPHVTPMSQLLRRTVTSCNEASQTVGVPPLDRRTAEGLLLVIPVPMAGGALLASGATVLAVLVLCAGVVIAFFGSLRLWRARPR